ncbi:MAG: hypothetical protein AB8B85_17275 [Paracoccaceae bacterium]
MTAKDTGRTAVSGLWIGLKRLRENWLLIAFVVTALYGVRDVYDEALRLPQRVKALTVSVVELKEGMVRLEDAIRTPALNVGDALSFPGLRHAATDGKPGEWVMARFRPVHALRPECRSVGFAAFMIDAERRWFSVQTDLTGWPRMDSLEELAFGVEVHPRMAVGRAQLLLQVVHDCSGQLQVDSSPVLPFRVLPAQKP